MADESDVRRIALSLPGTTERPSYGTPGFRVADKLFARIWDEPGVVVLWLSDESEKHALIATDPATFFTTPHYNGYASILVRLPAVDDATLTDLLTDAWRVRAPKRLRTQFDADNPTS